MPDYYYQIKGQVRSEPSAYEREMGEKGELNWKFPPLFSGMVTADTKKAAKTMIDEEYSRVFPQRVLRADMEAHPFLLSVTEMSDDPTDYIRRRFTPTECKECGSVFRLIDKYNDPNSETNSPHHCSVDCYKAGRLRDFQEFRLVNQGQIPPVIYCIRQRSTGQYYVGQTIKPFTLRWWQHLTVESGSKFHTALKNTADMTDWEFRVLEVVDTPPKGVRLNEFITGRERHWIDHYDSIANGLNTVRPVGVSSQQDLELDFAEARALF